MLFETSISVINLLLIPIVMLLYFIILQRNIKFTIILLASTSILFSFLYLVMDAPDVALTEAALGSCITTIILLKIAQSGDEYTEKPSQFLQIIALITIIFFALILCYIWQDMYPYGVGGTAVQNGVQSYYNLNNFKDTGITSFVAAILASYRGYDTLGETLVIMISGICILLICKSKSK